MATARTHVDPGLQPERTTLAWVRAAAVLAAVSVLYLRFVPGPGALVGTVGGCALLVAIIVIAAARRTHERRSLAFGSERCVPELAGNLGFTVLVAVMAGTAAIAVAVN